MEEKDKKITVCYSGGGTLGPIVPLLAIHDAIKTLPGYKSQWIITPDGPERLLLEKEGLVYKTLHSGKLRRYMSWENFLDVWRIKRSVFVAIAMLIKDRPSLCVSAGGYVSIPVHLAAALLRIPTWVHQQDADIGLANKLMAMTASRVTTALKETAESFSKGKTLWIGNPVSIHDTQLTEAEARGHFLLHSERVLVVFGGGTGSQHISVQLKKLAEKLGNEWSILHIVGKHGSALTDVYGAEYVSVPALTREEMSIAYRAASVVICRAGFSTLTELCYHKKPAIVVPLAGHQEKNAKLFDGSLWVRQVRDADLSADALASAVHELEDVLKEKKEEGCPWLPIPSSFVLTDIVLSLIEKTTSKDR